LKAVFLRLLKRKKEIVMALFLLPSMDTLLAEGKPYAASAGSILVLEYHPAIADMLTWALELRGYQTICVADGQEAVVRMSEAVSTQHIPTLILLDFFLSCRDGHVLLRYLREQWKIPCPPPPVLVMTTSTHDHAELGIPVLHKPFHLKTLFTLIQKLTTLSETDPEQGYEAG
jgi:DNA-binding response OmpR family regulator